MSGHAQRHTGHGLRNLVFAALAAAVISDQMSAPAFAQSGDEALKRRIAQLEEKIEKLRKRLGETPRKRTRRGAPKGYLPPSVAARFEVRMDNLERALEELTGKVEDLTSLVRRAAKARSKFERDVDSRFRHLARPQGADKGR